VWKGVRIARAGILCYEERIGAFQPTGERMNVAREKVMGLAEAVGRFVCDGAGLSIGGFTCNRNPMAAVYEIIRQRKRSLHLYAHSNGQGVDELVGAGCVARIEIAYAGTGRFAPTCIRFRRAVEQGRLAVEDYSNYQMTLRFMAGAMGVPFLPTRSALGTDIVARWGFAPGLRESDPGLPDRKLVVLENPFGTWGEAARVVLVPAIRPDVTLLHVQQAAPDGTARIEGLTFADVEQAKAARHVVLTCERLVKPEELRSEPERNQIPGIVVDAVVPVRYGAYPTACYRWYDYDPEFLSDYRTAASDDGRFEAYLERWAYRDHSERMTQVGPERLAAIQADPRTGYATGLKR
jgi:glutaconate CoA-transferase subunit A